jgi:LacI family repressor for deo operon, udp, cdd, tsx, nupC, and nupG
MKSNQVNIRKIAEIAGVSIASVSRALQDPPSQKISAAQREHILEICRQMRYYPNEHTKRMFARRSNTVALLFPPGINDSSDKILGVDINFVSCMTSIQNRLAREGFCLLLNEVNEGYLRDEKYLKMVRGNMVDGFLIWGAVTGENWIDQLMKEDIPVVLLQTSPDDCGCPLVSCDDYAGMSGVVKKALAAGHRDFAFFPAAESSSIGRKRNQAVRDTLNSCADAHCLEIGSGAFGYLYGREMTGRLLAASQEVSCIINPNDMAAWGCIDTLAAHGLHQPQFRIESVHLPAVMHVCSARMKRPKQQTAVRFR